MNDEHQFESDIETLMTGELGWTKGTDKSYVKWRKYALDLERLIDFVKATQQNAWEAFVHSCGGLDVYATFYRKFEDAVGQKGLVRVLRDGFHANGKLFKVLAPKPENGLNDTMSTAYEKNICQFVRQWHYSEKEPAKSVDIVLLVNGIPLVAIELKDELKGQTVSQAMAQWMSDRSPKEDVFRVNHRVLVFFAVDLSNVYMTTKLAAEDTRFLPFNQGSAGAGKDGGAGNPPAKECWKIGPRAKTDYLWHDVLQKDSFLDILNKFVNANIKEKTVLFPRYHQLDVVRKLVADVAKNGSGKSYLVQHSAGSGKSNSIAWIAYRLASLFNAENRPVFNSVIVVTDRRVLDKQLQDTMKSFNPMLGEVEVIDEDKTSRDLLAAIENGRRIIVSTLQKFPVIFKDVKKVEGKHFAIIVDEAHSSQTGESAAKMKYALADLKSAIAEYNAETGKNVSMATLDGDAEAQLALLMCAHGKHANLSYFAFTATPKDVTLDMFGTRQKNGSFRPFHTYSMRQAIEEGFIHDVLAYYTTYKRCTKIVKAIAGNPLVPIHETSKAIQKYKNLHPKNFLEKSTIIVDTFLDVTEKKYAGAKMMVVTDSRVAAVQYFGYIKDALKARGREDVLVMVAFSGSVEYPPKSGVVFTEGGMNLTKAGKSVKETQTKSVFHSEGGILIVAEKYQTGFDEPLLHTMVVDKKLRGVKAVQTLSRVNRICPLKTDTFVLDFVNVDEEIREAFQPFYQQTELEDEINVDLVFAKLEEIRRYAFYTMLDVEKVVAIHFSDGGAKTVSTQGKIVGAFVGVQKKYQGLEPKERALCRRQIRAFVRWYNYMCQITRVFDEETAKEHIFLSYLQHLLPADPHENFDLEDSVKLQYYKLKETFSGAIKLQDKNAAYMPPKPKQPSVMEQKKDELQTIIDSINAEYTGEFTEQDKVIMEMIVPILMESPKLRNAALSQTEQMYKQCFSGEMELATLEAYKQNDEAFKKLLEDKEKYEAVKRVLAQFTFQENLRRQRSLQDDAVDTPAHLWASGQVGVEMPIPEGYVAVLPVQAKWYKQIKDGVKRIEYREVSSRMTTMLIAKKPVAVRLMYGYAKTSMTWQVDKVVATNGTYAIHLGRRLV